MRVLFLTHRLPFAPNRGDRIRAYHIARHLARHHEIDLLSLMHDEEEESRAADLRFIFSRVEVARVPRASNLARAVAALPTSRPLTHVLLDAPGLRRRLAALVAERMPDVVLAYCSGMARLMFDESLRGVPAIVDFVDVDSEKWRDLARVTAPPRRWIYGREQRVLAGFEAAAAMHAHASIVVNDREATSLRAIAPRAHVHVVPNGVDLSTFRRDAEPATGATVIFCGVMNYAPNEQGALWLADSVWPIVRSQRPDARLLLVGASPTARLRSRAALDRSISVTGTVPDVRPYLRQSAVAAAPLMTARGIQNKVLEAIASGLPTVVTPAVSSGLPMEAAAACRVAAEPAPFAAAILDLLNLAPAERRAVAMRANLSALTWSERLAPLVEMVEEAAAPRIARTA